MEGLRGFAVSLVFLVHYTTLINPWLDPASLTAALSQGARGLGNTGVDLFFVLSGYLIYGHLIAREVPFVAYFRRRIQRIYPTFLTMFAIYAALSLAAPAHSKIPHGFLPAAQYLAENVLLLPGAFPIEPMITVAWSLSYEMVYYLATPLVIVGLGMRHWSPLARCILILGIAAAGTEWQHLEGGDLRWIMFLSGALLFETADKLAGKIADIAAPLALLSGFYLTYTLRGVDGTGPLRIWILFAAFYLLCLGCFTGRGLATRAACWAPLRLLGNMSYSYYLIHGLTLLPVFAALNRAFPQVGGAALFWALLPLAFAATLVPSAALFLAVEKRYSLNPRSRDKAVTARSS